MRATVICGLLALAGLWVGPASATTAGDSTVEGPHFRAHWKNAEYEDRACRVLARPRALAGEAARAWARYVRAYRAIQASPAARRLLARRPFSLRENDGIPGTLGGSLAAYGVTPAALAAQSGAVWTVQVASYTSPNQAANFVRRLADADGDELVCGIDERPVAIRLQCEHGYDPKEPLYLMQAGRWWALRYGLYENEHDAGLVAGQWQRRWGCGPTRCGCR